MISPVYLFWLVVASGACGGDLERELDEPWASIDGDADSDIDADADVDSDADSDGDSDSDVPAECDPGARRCDEGSLAVCRDDGEGWDVEECELGCLEDPDARCAEWVPSNVGFELLERGEGAIGPEHPRWRPDTTFIHVDTDRGSIAIYNGEEEIFLRNPGIGLDLESGIFFEQIAQPDDAPPLAVFSMTSLFIPPEIEVWVTGSHALVVASSGDIHIEGTLNCKSFGVDGRRDRYPGPGGYAHTMGPGAGGGGTAGSGAGTRDGGGGGAGFGGSGGSSGPSDLGGAGGVPYGSPELVPLYGGSGGGNGADAPGRGGPGGGACQLVSLTSIVIAPSGVLDAAGDFGRGGNARGGGGGGGSGGGLLLEAPSVLVEGRVTANGGGGGSGAVNATWPGTDGERGLPVPEAAPGGISHSDWEELELGCDGGHGSSSTEIDGADTNCEPNDDDGGGGGGGAGRIRLNGLTVEHAGAVLSPDVSTPAATVGPLPIL